MWTVHATAVVMAELKGVSKVDYWVVYSVVMSAIQWAALSAFSWVVYSAASRVAWKGSLWVDL